MEWQPSTRKEVLSVVERGWRGARECSIVLNAMAIPVTHLIKGCLSRGLRAMIHPYPYIRLVSIPRPIFRLWLWGTLVWDTVTGRVRWLLIDHERTLRQVSWWCRRFGLTSILIQERDQGYELQVNGRALPFTAVFKRSTNADRPRL